MDVLSDILQSVHLGGGVRFRCELSAPWGMAMKASPAAEFHVIVRGSCWLHIAGRKEPIALQGGDLVAFLHGDGHRLVDRPGGKARPIEDIVAGQNLDHYGPVTHGGDGMPATILCGYFEFDRDRRHPLVAALPPVILLRGTDGAEFAWLQTALNFMIHETKAARPGAEAVVNRLVGVLFIQMVRAHLAQSRAPHGVLAAIADRQIGAALRLVHQAPQRALDAGVARQGGGHVALGFRRPFRCARRAHAVAVPDVLAHGARARAPGRGGSRHRGDCRAGRLPVRSVVQQGVQEGGGRRPRRIPARPCAQAMRG
ncbi:MAG: cupin domain-containing protein [Burkholderiales bacterium]|nr:cupin domain-containing protein [Burkholderiales bacterium]